MNAAVVDLALVLNPVKVTDPDTLTAELTRRCVAAGWAPPLVLTTTEQDPGTGQTRRAVAAGARVVVAAGGDGTVRAVAQELVGTRVSLAVLPEGTGNLLVRNLALPLDVDAALTAAFEGVDRRIDVGRLGDGTVFTVMAGAGLDAAMMQDAPEGLKAVVGWPAYLVGGLRGLRRPPVRVSIDVDGRTVHRGRARTVLIGNLGRLQGGLQLLPDARPDDGLLDVAVVGPRTPLDWLRILARTVTGRHRPDHRLRSWEGRRIDVRLHRVQPRQIDGDLIADADRLTARIDPASLSIRVTEEP